MIDSPPARRLLGAALRLYRENLGLMLEDAARVLECDRSKISRIETGQRGIRPKELRELLTEYGVGEPEQSTLAIIARPGRRGGWQQYGDVIPGPFRDYLALEQAASEIFVYDPQHVPDLLQTPEYAQAGVTADPSLPTGTLAGIALCRQQVLGERRVGLTALIGEAALHDGNCGPGVMRGQLRALADSSGRIVVQVLPSGCGAPSSGPATILRFAGVPSLGVVYLPGLGGGVSLAGERDVASYARAFEHLRALALTPAVSARLLREMAAG